VADSRGAPVEPGSGFRKELSGVTFPVEARIAQGKMTVRDLLDLVPGAVVRSATPAGAKVLLAVGRVGLAVAEPFVEEGNLVVRIVRIETPDA
jgi:flagellar motor switch protein FliM